MVPAQWMGQSHHKPLVWGKWPTFQSQWYIFWLRKSPTCKSLKSRRSIIRCLPFSLLFLRRLLWHHCQRRVTEVGGLLAWPCTTIIVVSGHKAMGLRAGYGVCYRKEEAWGSSMDALTFPHRILCIKITVNYFIYLYSYSCRKEYVDTLGKLDTEKKNQKKRN